MTGNANRIFNGRGVGLGIGLGCGFGFGWGFGGANLGICGLGFGGGCGLGLGLGWGLGVGWGSKYVNQNFVFEEANSTGRSLRDTSLAASPLSRVLSGLQRSLLHS